MLDNYLTNIDQLINIGNDVLETKQIVKYPEKERTTRNALGETRLQVTGAASQSEYVDDGKYASWITDILAYLQNHFASSSSEYIEKIKTENSRNAYSNFYRAKVIFDILKGFRSGVESGFVQPDALLRNVDDLNRLNDAVDLDREVLQVNAEDYYNLFVVGDTAAYTGNRFVISNDRVLTEYISDEVAKQFPVLNTEVISQIKSFPTLFANENNLGENQNQEAFFGFVTDIKMRDNGVNVYYQKLASIPQRFLIENAHALAIHDLELNRTHWTIKNINLKEELADAGIVIQEAAQRAININTHEFDVAVTFAGENRPLVKNVVDALSDRIATNRIFYDEFYQAYLACPALDTLLQDIYHKRSKLIVVFISEAYCIKEWCGIEYRPIRDIIKKKENDKIMFIRVDDAELEGNYSTDGYIDARTHDPQQIANYIFQRIKTIR